MLLKNDVIEVEGRTSKHGFLTIYLTGEIGFDIKERRVAYRKGRKNGYPEQ